MRLTRLAFAVLAASSFAFSAGAREGNTGSEPERLAQSPSPESFGAQNEIAENLPDCRKVDIDLDEGYGVTGHATRDECPPRRRRLGSAPR
ncbi:hypothetical protein [Methylocystis bryophila]|uniref:Porin n=1 Tax=Methylocystis bryophila TaxID=655015 RepID=A0A1W6MYA4_9HYPH|nr:hypothetical protein [Methylocystis bryophila]ARN82570.1 hypothetical protein B1812_17415 [Methylocystis bryophila]BDV38780.1 hypothetical protein DSM21852_20330 [Methylocystis bryophila]